MDDLLSKASFEGVRKALYGRKSALLAQAAKALEEQKKAAAPRVDKPAPTVFAGDVLSNNGGSVVFVPIDNFAWDQGDYNSSVISIYVDGLEGVGSIPPERVVFSPQVSSFDLTIRDLDGKNYRLLKDNLEKDIIPEESKMVVKKDKIVLKLKKKKGEYSYETWTSLTAKKSKDEAIKSKADPMGGLMDMMKEMYDSGDDKTKAMIGEAMLKSREKKDSPV